MYSRRDTLNDIEFVKSSVVFGCAGPTLTEAEFDFFRENLPFGFILFSRNIANIEQVKQLCYHLESLLGGMLQY